MAEAVQILRSDLTRTERQSQPAPSLGPGSVLLRVESFAVTANNVTYAVMGEGFGYWNFFPAPEGWGIVPMWGHAIVEASEHPDIAVGERVYGYLPMASHLRVEPGNISKGSFSDMAAHRQPMSPVYNQYRRLEGDPTHDPAREAQRMIFQPLFGTSFLIEAMFAKENWFGADTLVMTSASSKTSLALAHVARAKAPQIRRIGLTSAGNCEFVAKSGLYDEVLSVWRDRETGRHNAVSVDFAGNSSVLRAIHEALGDGLKYSCLVGATHVDARGQGDAALPGPAPILFFAPDHMNAAVKEMGFMPSRRRTMAPGVTSSSARMAS
ncbi:MAG: DUF2855 family protein [Sphingomonadales bacterium]|nr:DUF2855 family protein [Sphingomonadales bacterium]